MLIDEDSVDELAKVTGGCSLNNDFNAST